MIDKRARMEHMVAALTDVFGERLLFVGLQGSYRRDEATAASDFDAVVVLDRLDVKDLLTYRTLLDGMPDRDKACGFISGREELARWPRYELFQFRNDTETWFGNLDAILPPVSRQDIADSIRFAASSLYHAACHTFLHAGEGREEILRGLYKPAFFTLQAVWYLRRDEYIGTRRDLLERLENGEREVLRLACEWPEPANDRELDARFELLLHWSGDLLKKGEFDG